MGIIYMFGGSHKSDFHNDNVTQYGSKMCHRSVTGVTQPSMVCDRQHPCLGVEPMKMLTVEAADSFARQLNHAQEEAKAALEQAADDMKWYYDQNHQTMPEYKVRDKAWLSLQNYSSNCPMKKLDHKWAGPFTITKVISPATIKLHLSS